MTLEELEEDFQKLRRKVERVDKRLSIFEIHRDILTKSMVQLLKEFEDIKEQLDIKEEHRHEDILKLMKLDSEG